jgi:ubiquinone biosynthesis protein
MRKSWRDGGYRWQRLALLAATAFRHGAPLAFDLLRGRPVRQEDVARRLRAALEALGLTYLKLGQFLATRHDLVPAAVVRELTALFEDVPALPAATVAGIVARELGAARDGLFASFDPVPVAAATVAQVHRAELTDGSSVAVKVQRPGIEALFEADIAILRSLARLGDRLGLLGSLSAVAIADQFAAYTRREFDFLLEASTAERLRREARPECIVPRIVPELTTRRVLTMQFMEGVSLARICTLVESGDEATLRAVLPSFDRRRVLENLTLVSLHQFFVTGFFHGDPHPGNILVCPDNRVVLLDFGIFGELGAAGRDLLASYAEHLAMGNVAESFRHLSQIYFPGPRSDRRAFRQDAIAALRRWYVASRDPSTPMRERHLGGSFDAMVGVVRRHRYWTTMDYLLFWRAIIVLDSIALRLDNDFDLTGEIRRFFEDLRPAPLERAMRIAADPRWAADVRSLVTRLRSRSETLTDRTTWRSAGLRLAARETGLAERSRNRRTRSLACAAASMGLATAVPAAPSGAVGATILVAAVAAAAMAGSLHDR